MSNKGGKQGGKQGGNKGESLPSLTNRIEQLPNLPKKKIYEKLLEQEQQFYILYYKYREDVKTILLTKSDVDDKMWDKLMAAKNYYNLSNNMQYKSYSNVLDETFKEIHYFLDKICRHKENKMKYCKTSFVIPKSNNITYVMILRP